MIKKFQLFNLIKENALENKNSLQDNLEYLIFVQLILQLSLKLIEMTLLMYSKKALMTMRYFVILETDLHKIFFI
jgi:hypothetical protein